MDALPHKQILATDINLLKQARVWIDIRDALEHAFESSPLIAGQLADLQAIADSFRNGGTPSKAAIASLAYAYRNAAYSAKVAFLNSPDNNDIKEYLFVDPYSDDFKKSLFDEYTAKAKKVLLESTDFSSVRKRLEMFSSIGQIDRELQSLGEQKDKKDTEEAKELLKSNPAYLAIMDAQKDFEEGYRELPPGISLREAKRQYSAKIKRITEKIKKDIAETGTYAHDIRQQIQELTAKRTEAMKKIDDYSFRTYADIKAALRDNSPVTDEEAKSWVENNISFDSAVIDYLKKSNINMEYVKEDIANFYQLIGGKISGPVSICHKNKDGGRSYASPSTRELSWDDAKLSTLFHELGHFVESDNREFYLAARSFIEQRATGRAQKLSGLTGILGYGDDEKAFPDSFLDPYVGKDYPYETTEVLSMGMECLCDLSSFRKGIKDVEHLQFIVGCLASSKQQQLAATSISTHQHALRKISYSERDLAYKDWLDAIDAATDESFKQKMLADGFEHLHIEQISTQHVDGYYCVLYKDKRLPAYGSESFRIAYLTICHYKKLLPDNIPGSIQAIFKALNTAGSQLYWYRPPAWFAKGYILPKVV